MKRTFFPLFVALAIYGVCFGGSTFPIAAQQYSSYPYSSTRYAAGSSLISDEGVNYTTPQSSAELGLRYLKLGNTYREARNIDLAQSYLRRGLDLVRGLSSRYWEGVANEYLGLTYRDMGDRMTALEYLRRAEAIYRSIMNPLRTESSLDAVQKIVSDVDYGWRYFGRPALYDASGAYTNSAYANSTYVGNTYPSRGFVGSYTPEAREYERLQRINMLLTAQLQDLDNRLRVLEQTTTSPGR